jgi:hypothetical protein
VDINQLVNDILAYVPNVIGALVILFIGAVIALIVAAVVRAVLRRIDLDDRLAGAVGGRRMDLSGWLSTAAFWLIMLFVFIAAFQALNLPLIATPLNLLLAEVFQFIPRLLAALALALIAWVVATLLRAVVVRLLTALNLDDRLGRSLAEDPARPTVPEGAPPRAAAREAAPEARPGPAAGETAPGRPPLARTIGEAVYWLVWLLFLPMILNALGLEGLLAPVQTLLNQVLAFLPNLAAAALILAVGWFVARVVQRIVTNLLAAVGVDRLSEQVGLAAATGGQRLSALLGLIVYVLILLPVILAALNALRLEALTAPVSDMISAILLALPRIFAAALVLVIAYAVGRVVAGLVRDLLAGVGFDGVAARLGLGGEPRPGQRTPSDFVGWLVLIGIMLFATIQALALLEFAAVAALVAQFTVLLGQVVMGLVIFGVGIYLANLAASAVRRSGVAKADWLAVATRIAVLILAGAMALRQMGLAEDIVNLAFTLLLGAVAVAAALAFGLGGRDVAGGLLREWESGVRTQPPPPGLTPSPEPPAPLLRPGAAPPPPPGPAVAAPPRPGEARPPEREVIIELEPKPAAPPPEPPDEGAPPPPPPPERRP